MTKKHFKAIAEAMRSVRPDKSNIDALEVWRQTCARLAAMCAEANPRFDRSRFFGVCND